MRDIALIQVGVWHAKPVRIYLIGNGYMSRANERVAGVEINEDVLSVNLMDGRTITVPLVWYPRLLNASESERKNWQVCGGGYGIHWPDIDEDLSTGGMLQGAPAPRQR
jgi:hypothetical protein